MLTNFFNRISWAVKAFNLPLQPVIQTRDGIMLDLEHRRIIIPGDFTLHAKGDLRLSADKHVIIKSGQNKEERNGYVNSIWLNSKEDELGRPLMDINERVIENGCNEHGKY